MIDIYQFLETHGIEYQRFDHEPVFTVEESSKLPKYPGAGTKNLFLRDKKATKYFLVVVSHEKRVDLKKLSEVLGVSRLGFGNAEMLNKLLGVEPGSVTLLGIIHDTKQEVTLVIDSYIWCASHVQCHPLTNSSTLVIANDEIKKIIKITDHMAKIIHIPEMTV